MRDTVAMLTQLKQIQKALVATAGAALAAALPQIADSLSEWVAGLIGVAAAGLGTYLVRNAPPAAAEE